MKSRTTKKFRKAFALLPLEIQLQAEEAYRQFMLNPWHSGLRFKQIHPNIPIYSIRVTKDYQAVGQKSENAVVWFWIGSHADYEKLILEF